MQLPGELSDAPQRAVRLRESLSLGLMLVPLAAVAAFLLLHPAVWGSELAVFFSQDSELLRRDAGWILAALALVAALLCAWIGVLGTRENWQVNRRWQRGVLGSIAAVLATVLLSAWSMTETISRGETPSVGLAAFATMCAILYGVLCAAVSPRDLVSSWAAEPLDPEGLAGPDTSAA